MPSSNGFTIDHDSFARVSSVVNRVERMPETSTKDVFGDTGNDGNFDDWVLTTTGTADGSGWYAAKTQEHNATTNTWTDTTPAGVVYIRGPNGETLTDATRYRGNITGEYSGKTAYQMVGTSAAGGSLTVEEFDGTPTVTGVTTLSFVSADGFIVSDPGGGVAQLDLAPVAASQIGVVDLSDQVMGAGQKSFPEAVMFRTARFALSGGVAFWAHGQSWFDSAILFTDVDLTTTSPTLQCGSISSVANEVRVTAVDTSGGGQGIGLYIDRSNFRIVADENTTNNLVKFSVRRNSVFYNGATGTFTTVDGKTITVTGGIVTAIV